MKCLSCGQNMVTKLARTPRGPVCYDVCQSCCGIWFDAGEMDATVFQLYGSVERSSTDKAEGVSEARRDCPRCPNQVLDKVFFLAYSDILLDYCRTCHGFWLDGGEYKRINQDLRELKNTDNRGEIEPLERWILAFMKSLGYSVGRCGSLIYGYPVIPPYSW